MSRPFDGSGCARPATIVLAAMCLVGCRPGFGPASSPEKPAMSTSSKSTFDVRKDSSDQGRDVAVVSWRTGAGAEVAQVRVPVSGLGRIGPVEIQLTGGGGNPNANEWDTREWQWWKDYPFPPEQMRPRELARAEGGAEPIAGGVRVWARYICDGVETTQEWSFMDLADGAPAAYDCLITIRNTTPAALADYGQFFASYTAWNGQRGHFYWSADGTLVNYKDRGSQHLDYYVAAPRSAFEKLGHVPWCPRNGGKIKATWKHPVSVSHPGPAGHRHVVMSEEARTSALAQGMNGIAQDYLVYPLGGDLKPGQSFTVHVRHLIVKAGDDELLEALDAWWAAFAKDHDRVRAMTRFRRH